MRMTYRLTFDVMNEKFEKLHSFEVERKLDTGSFPFGAPTVESMMHGCAHDLCKLVDRAHNQEREERRKAQGGNEKFHASMGRPLPSFTDFTPPSSSGF